jgi:N12 class adenine-specific DNA methylase
MAISPSGWLPGFEPEDFLSGPAVQAVSMVPPQRPTAVALVAAAVVHQAMHAEPVISTEVINAVYGEALDESQQPHQEASNDAAIALDDAPEPPPPKQWPQFDPARFATGKSVLDRVEQNIAAVELMHKLRDDPTLITDDDRHQLLSYSGWGGAARMFEDLPGNSLAPQRKRFQGLVSEEEFASARASVTSAYYTDPVVIRTMWQIVRQLGFTGGRMIEPAGGTGLFLANMPAELAQQSEITAVELDKVSAKLMELVFGGLGVHVHNSPIEKAPVPHGFFDLAISNVPFGDHKSLETSKVGYSEWAIHNYFIGKAIDLVRPGGLVAVITSSFTMDSKGSSHRDWINAHAELLGAIRLPDTAFKQSAATEVVTDILVFKKREAPKFTAVNLWKNLDDAPEQMMRPGQNRNTYYQGRTITRSQSINEWYAAKPHMLIGELVYESGMYGADTLKAKFGGSAQEFEERLQQAVKQLPTAVYEPAKTAVAGPTSLLLQTVQATSKVKPGGFIVHEGRICISQDDFNWIDLDDAYTGKARERLLGLIGLKETSKKLLQAQIESDADADFKQFQLELNIRYDAFIAKHGFVADKANVKVFRTDPDCPLVLSLEQYDENTETYCKADIFSKRTAGKITPPAHVENVKDAMLVSLSVHGRINIGDMAMRMGKPAKQVVQEMRNDGLAYMDSEDHVWKPADEYLSGNIRHKIEAATAAGKKYVENVGALKAVLPEDLGPADVEIRLGAPWVPVDVVEQFIRELVDLKPSSYQDVHVAYNANAATWSVTNRDSNRRYLGDHVLNNVRWGTSARCAVTLVEAALNQVPPKITKTVDDKTVVDRAATLEAREKFEAIRQEFKAWAYRDDDRRDRLLRIYNDEFNQIVERKFDGSHLALYGMSLVITPYKSQMDAIWRMVSGGNTLLAHAVGAGKTFIMIAAVMEMRRLGKANKPLLVTPNHLLHQFVGDCVRFYPNAKVLMASKEDFQGDRRREFVSRIACGDWDAVVMTHSTFERIATSPDATQGFVDELCEQVRNSLGMAEERNAKRTVKQCEKQIKALEAKIERAFNQSDKDDVVYFDQLGIDYICIDEAQAVKNLMRVSKMPSIAGLSNAASNRAFDAWVKTSLIMQARGHKEEGVTFASATPISNSVAEAFTMQKFLQPYTLKRMGLYEFDAWAATFGEAVQSMEISPDGGGYRLATRFSRFTNVPDLMAIFRMVADIRTRSMLNLPCPQVKGGKATVISSEPSLALKEYTQALVERADKIRSGQVKPEEDNMLAVTNCGRKAALDMRLIVPSMPFDTNGKVAKAVENIMRIWHETADKRGTQILFCDLSTPQSVGFSVYDDLRQRLIDAGMPAHEIAFIHDHDSDTAKDVLFRQVRAGRVRLLMGSTLKLGVGTNVQRRLKAVHQLDAPWRPDSVEQRDGRGLRVGNMWDEIELLRYVTTESFDSYSWMLLETKARFIEQVMTAPRGMRSVEDVAMGALSYAEIKAIASGNPLVLEKATVDAQVAKYSMLRSSWEQNRWLLKIKLDEDRKMLAKLQATQAAVEQDARIISQELETGLTFKTAVQVKGMDYATLNLQQRIGSTLLAVSKSPVLSEQRVGTISSMDIVVSRYDGIDVKLVSRSDPGLYYRVRRQGTPIYDVFGTGKLITDLVESLVTQPTLRAQRMEHLRKECANMDANGNEVYEHESKLTELIRRQRSIEAELDLDKSEAGAEMATATNTD